MRAKIPWAKIAPPKCACSNTFDEKAPPPRCPSFWMDRGGNAPPCLHSRCPCAYYSTCTLFTRCCKLQSVTVMNINYQRYPKTEQFLTGKICGNTLKQGSRTYSVLRQRSPQLQKHKASRMFCRIAVDQKVCGWDGGHPGSTVWNLHATHELRMRIKYARNFLFFIMWLLCVQLLRRKNHGRNFVVKCGGTAWCETNIVIGSMQKWRFIYTDSQSHF